MEGIQNLLPSLIGPILLFLAGLGFGLSVVKLWQRDRQYWRAMHRFSKDWLHGVVLPNSPEEDTFIEHLTSLPGGIVVVSIMDFPGAIFGASNMEYWTQVVNRRSFRFPNPLERLQTQVGLVKETTQQNDVVGHVLFADDCVFPKGIPEGVSKACDLNSAFSNWRQGVISESRQAAWRKLQEFASDQHELVKSNTFLSNRHRFKIRLALMTILILTAVLWGIWVYVGRFWAGEV